MEKSLLSWKKTPAKQNGMCLLHPHYKADYYSYLYENKKPLCWIVPKRYMAYVLQSHAQKTEVQLMSGEGPNKGPAHRSSATIFSS